MSMTAEIATDLLTPLGAYLRLREGAPAAFLLESVERGRLGRHSFVGRGARLVAEVLIGDAEEAVLLLDAPQPEPPRGAGERGKLRRFPERDEHLRRVERAKEHIREGDVFQVVIAQRAERPTSASAFELYR